MAFASVVATLVLGLAASAEPGRAATANTIPAPLTCLADTPTAVRPALDSIPKSRRDRLSRGVNMTDLFVDGSEPDLPGVFARLRRSGVRHIRVPVSPLVFAPVPPAWQAAVLRRLDSTVCAAVAADLGVIIDLHPFENLQPEGGTTEQIATRLKLVWRQLAARYATASPDHVFFEMLNEPKLPDGVQWAAMQADILQAIRSVAPANTVIATASPWSTAAALSALPPLADRNVAYTFHFYTPMIFTHQAASWSVPSYGTIRSLEFPAKAGNVAAVAAGTDPSLRSQLAWYGDNFHDAGLMTGEIDLAAAWSRTNSAVVVSTEFGVFNNATPRDARAKWLGIVRAKLESAGMGWTVWEYKGGWGIDHDLVEGCGASNSAATSLRLCRS
ncbi:glycoside hydrolase family 5 protein [Lichenicola cladoniae]|uniref:Glycoside hydrolase family 5 protein n=1 Tax=Lichenicola cladoniae TaxID=1484109 RepID=A0A6M8HTX4_9PROT|nr:glycoside hydrolase family 5 protein [Lichenicola cladoniae]NPD67634.1 glycoside hydrolase family 5 protein [Acetobacteraceae bacterium]QKE91726.1 glycoside hydrolase family 5 protein [Lichenicola cladoniae]